MTIIRLTLIAIALVVSTSLFSCAKSQSPVEEYVEIFQSAADELSKATTDEEATRILAEGSKEWTEKETEIMNSNSDYKLTAEDKQILRDAMKTYMEITIRKSLEISQQSTEGVQEMASNVLEATIYPTIDRAETLGDLAATPHK